MTSPVSAVLLLIGLAACAQWRGSVGAFFLPAWFLAGLLLGSILVIDPPSYTRLIGIFPAHCILIAVGAQQVWRMTTQRVALPRKLGAAVACLFLLYAGWFNLRSYHQYARRMEDNSGEWDVVKVLERNGPSMDYYLFTGPFLYGDASVFRLWASGARTMSAFTENDIPDRLDRDSVFVVMPDMERFGYAITNRFPGAELDVVEGGRRVKLFVYRCTVGNGCRKGLA